MARQAREPSGAARVHSSVRGGVLKFSKLKKKFLRGYYPNIYHRVEVKSEYLYFQVYNIVSNNRRNHHLENQIYISLP